MESKKNNTNDLRKRVSNLEKKLPELEEFEYGIIKDDEEAKKVTVDFYEEATKIYKELSGPKRHIENEILFICFDILHEQEDFLKKS